MGFLADLGAGIQRGALAGAGALSDEVYREQANQRAARATEGRAEGRAQRLAVAQHIMQAVHGGQVDDAYLPELQQQLSKMGYNIPMQAFGPSIEAKHLLATYANGIAKQKRAEEAAKQLMDYKFGGQPGLVPDGLTSANASNIGLAGRPGLSQLDAMMPKGDPQSSSGIDFTPDHFDQAPSDQVPGMPPKLRGLPPPIVQTPTGVPKSTLTGPTGVQSFAYNPNAQTGQELETQAEMPQSPDGTYQLPPMEVTGKLPQRPSMPQQSVATPAIPSSASPLASLSNIQAGTPDMNELYRRAMGAMQNDVHGGKDMLDYFIKTLEERAKPDYMSVGEGQSVFDKHTGKMVMQVKPKTNFHVVDGALVDDAGNVVYKGSPDQIKAVQEFNAFLDQSGITDPSVRQQKWAKYVDRKGEGIQVNNYPSPIAVTKPDGTQAMVQFGNKGETRETSYLPPAKDKVQKALPNPAVEKLSAAGAALENTNRQVSTFKDEYGGHTLAGEMSNTAGRILGDNSGQAQWWQDFEASANQTRHALFGSALTQTELAAWTKTTITPRMNSDEIRKNLTRRIAIETSAAQKLARGYTALGYSPDAIAEFIGPQAASFVDASSATAKSPQASKQLPPGMPTGSVFYKYSSRGNRVWKSPDGKLMEDME